MPKIYKMIKNIGILIILSVSCNYSFSQNDDLKSKVLDIIAIESCDCIRQKNIDFETEEIETITKNFGLCIIQSYTNNKEEADKHLDIAFTDSNSMRQLGEQVGVKMLSHCPDYVMALAKDTKTTNQVVTNEITDITGVVFNVEKSNMFVIVEIKDDLKRSYKLLWLEYFEGENVLRDLNKINKTKVKISYEDTEMYDPKINEYRNFKIIKKLSIL